MKSLISINYKFMSISPKELVSLILESKYTKGIEAYININDEKEMKYLDSLTYELKRNNLILQIHGNIQIDLDKQIKYLKILEQYSSYLGYPIVFTLHTIYDKEKNTSLSKTIDYISKLLESVDSNKIVMCLEYLNDTKEYTRLGKEEIRTTILNDEKIYFTYDIGHEIDSYRPVTNLDKYMIEDIRNIHLHSTSKGVDHKPIYKNDSNSNSIVKALTFLKINKYQYNIVYEYALEFCSGNTTKERVIDYLNSIDFVAQRYEK